MAFYEYMCVECPAAPLKGKYHLSSAHLRNIPMSKAPPIGAKVKCPACKRKSAARIIGTGIVGVVKGNEKSKHSLGHGTTIMTKMNGIDTPLTFVDHKHTDPAVQAQMSALAKRAGIGDGVPSALKHAYRNNDGKLVVDVKSSVPDPLGMMKRNKVAGDYSETTHKVGQKYRVRGKK